MRPLQGAAGHGPLPRPQVIGDEGQVTLKVPFFKTNKTLLSLCNGQKKSFAGPKKYSSAGAKVTKERDNAPLCLGVIPTAWLEQAMCLPLPLLAFRAQLHWEVWGGSLRAIKEAT